MNECDCDESAIISAAERSRAEGCVGGCLMSNVRKNVINGYLVACEREDLRARP